MAEHSVSVPVPAVSAERQESEASASWPRSWQGASESYSGSLNRSTSGIWIERVAQLRQRCSPASRPNDGVVTSTGSPLSWQQLSPQLDRHAASGEVDEAPVLWLDAARGPRPAGGSSITLSPPAWRLHATGNSGNSSSKPAQHGASDQAGGLHEPLLAHAAGEEEEQAERQPLLPQPPCSVCVESAAGGASFTATALNTINILCGVGMLATPYALASSGLAALLLLPLLGAAACYTGNLIAACLSAAPGCATYPDIGGLALGRPGRLLVSVLLYLELFACCVDFLILDGDNLAAALLAGGAGQAVPLLGQVLSGQQAMILLAAGVVLPTVLLRDMSLLSYVSVGGITSSVALLALVGWEGLAYTGFPHAHMPLVRWRGVPLALGLYSFCFAGHAVFPSLYSSMAQPARWGRLLALCFSLAVALYAATALLGAAMFGPGAAENLTLDMQVQQPGAPPTVLAMWLVIVSPLTKIGLTLAPVALALEELLPLDPKSSAFAAASLLLRTTILASTAAMALLLPFFAAVMSFIGAFLSMSIAIVLPCVFYLAIHWQKLGPGQRVLPCLVAALGVVAGAAATYDSIKRVAGRL